MGRSTDDSHSVPPRGPAGSARRFNLACAAAALVVLAASQFARPASTQDFSQYYMGGLMARLGQWEALYPTPLPDSIYNAGWGDQSTVHPDYKRRADERGIGEFGFRYIQSPPVALVFAPLSLLSFADAHRAWTALLVLCMWAIAVQAGLVYRHARGREDFGAGAAILLVAMSVLAYRAVRVGNVSPIVGMCVGFVVLDLVRARAGRGFGLLAGVALAVGAFAKYATPVLVPIHLVMKRWSPIAWSAVVVAALVGATWLYAGSEPFATFAREIAPTLGRSHPHRANQSFEGLLLRLTDAKVLSREYTIGLRVVQSAAMLLILWLLARSRRSLPRAPRLVFAAAAVLVCWLLLFGPLYWEHYPVYLCPLWGWLIAEGRESIPRAILAALAIALAWVPVQAIQWLALPEIVNSSIMVSTILIAALACWRLARPAATGADAAPVQ